MHVRRFGERETTLERIDVRGHYTPKNCKWATQREQSFNKTNTLYAIDLVGKKHNISEITKNCGLKYGTIRQRIQNKWTYEDIVGKPARKHKIAKSPTKKGGC